MQTKKEFILTKTNEVGRVESVDFVKDQFDLLTKDAVIKRYSHTMYQKTLPRDTTFSYDSSNITYNTFQVIGEDEALKEKTRVEALEEKMIQESSKKFAQETFNSLFPLKN